MADFSKETYKKALATVLGIETIAGSGPTGKAGRAALDTAMRGFLRGGRLIASQAPRAALRGGGLALRGAAGISPAGWAIIGGLTLAEAYERGLLDAPIERGRQEFSDIFVEGIERASPFVDRLPPPPLGMTARRKKKPSKYNRAVKAGMAAVKRSKFGGPKGKLTNPKKAFGTVNKAISRLKKGLKAPNKGINGTIAKAVKRML